MPIDLFTQIAANKRRQEGSDVDAHVKDRKPRYRAAGLAGL